MKYSFAPALKLWLRSHVHLYDAVIIHGLWQYHGVVARRCAATAGVPYFVFTHGMLDPWFNEQHPGKYLKKLPYWLSFESRNLAGARAVLFTSEEERRAARASFPRYRARERVVRYGTGGLSFERAEMRAEFFHDFPDLANKRLILFLSRIHSKKGCDLLVAAFKKVANENPTVHLVVAGPDQEGLGETLRSELEAVGLLERTSWVGMLQGRKKWSAFCAADVFCLPSHQENFAIVVAEALSCGTPVIISDKVNIWREISEDRAGFICNDTADGVLSALNAWLELGPDALLDLKDSALRCFAHRFHIDSAADDIEALLRSSDSGKRIEDAAS